MVLSFTYSVFHMQNLGNVCSYYVPYLTHSANWIKSILHTLSAICLWHSQRNAMRWRRRRHTYTHVHTRKDQQEQQNTHTECSMDTVKKCGHALSSCKWIKHLQGPRGNGDTNTLGKYVLRAYKRPHTQAPTVCLLTIIAHITARFAPAPAYKHSHNAKWYAAVMQLQTPVPVRRAVQCLLEECVCFHLYALQLIKRIWLFGGGSAGGAGGGGYVHT